MPLNQDFWENKYLQGHMPWDIGQAAPAFVKYFRDESKEQRTEKVAVLGCGRGHDTFFLRENNNFNVYGFDYSKNAINYCKKINTKKNFKNIQFYQLDFFQLLKDKKWKNYFDYVVEHTSFCAIDPKLRKNYFNLIHYLLKPSGKLVGLFFVRPRELGGPPYGTSVNEVRKLLKKDFKEIEKLHLVECLHKGKLEGDEYFGVLEKI